MMEILELGFQQAGDSDTPSITITLTETGGFITINTCHPVLQPCNGKPWKIKKKHNILQWEIS